MNSPGGVLTASLFVNPEGRLMYTVSRAGAAAPLIEPSPLGVWVDDVDLGDGVTIGEPVIGRRDETYPTRGGHSVAYDRCVTVSLPVTHMVSGHNWNLEARLFDDGFAFRYRIPSAPEPDTERTVQGEASSWRLPAGSRVWIAERRNDWKLKSYAGWWLSVALDDLPTVSPQGPVQAPPLVFELPDAVGGGFAAISEAALHEYSGMRLRAVGDRTFTADFTEGAAGFPLVGEIRSPWRVLLAAPDLNGLVNADIWTNLNPPPDPGLYPDTEWIRTGRAAWRWWSQGTGTPDEEREYMDHARRLGWEFSLVDDGWKDWPDAWDRIAEMSAYGREIGVGVLVWKDYKDGIGDPSGDYAALTAYLDACVHAGVTGVKIDFMNAESLDRVRFQHAALRKTAERRLLLLFHGCQKPTGESRTFPHEVTREGIRGLELNKMSEGPILPSHNAALPFTRYLVGHGDYTPVGFSNPGPTTWGHQLATAVLFTSPLNVIAENPEVLLNDPRTQTALDILRSLPTVWDETRVLPPSAIGERAIMARRSGDVWYLAALTGDSPMPNVDLPLSFLDPERRYAVTTIATGETSASLMRTEREMAVSDKTVTLRLFRADGSLTVFRPA